MSSLSAPALKPLKSFCKTPAHGTAVADWVTRHSGVDVTYDPSRKGWAHEGEGRAAVVTALTELSRRILYHHVKLPNPSALVVSALRRRLSHWRTSHPKISVYTWPDTRPETPLPAELSVWVVALPPDAYGFAEAASEFQGLRDRFSAVSWQVFYKSSTYNREEGCGPPPLPSTIVPPVPPAAPVAVPMPTYGVRFSRKSKGRTIVGQFSLPGSLSIYLALIPTVQCLPNGLERLRRALACPPEFGDPYLFSAC